MIKRLMLIVLLAAISGALVFGAVHRTGHVLTSLGQDSGTVQTQGQGNGRGQAHGNGQGQGARGGQAGRAAVDTAEGAY
jgi:hypothetical protein